MGSSKMTSLKITLLPLAICLLLCLNSQVSGKPSPKHLLIETKEKAKRTSDYDINAGHFKNGPGGTVISNDYDINAGHFKNGLGGTVISNDYDINAGYFKNGPGGTVISNDYDINAGSFHNSGFVGSFGGK